MFYCGKCLRIISAEDLCKYCNSHEIYDLRVGTPVNVLGTKEKGKIFKMSGNKVKVIIKTESKEKIIREYDAERLRKII